MSKEYDERMHERTPEVSGHESQHREMPQRDIGKSEVTQRDTSEHGASRQQMSEQDLQHERERQQMSRGQEAMHDPMHKGEHMTAGEGQGLAALFTPDVAQEFRNRWDSIQIGFVDDPRRAVQQADELVEQVMRNLTQTFTRHRSSIEAGVRESEQASTEHLRMALQHYRSFFQRLLSL